MIRHISLMIFKKGTSEDKIKELMERLGKIEKDLPGILSFSWGKNISHQYNFTKGYTHAFLFDFQDAKLRDAYLGSSEHKRKTDAILPFLDPGSIAVFDYEVKK